MSNPILNGPQAPESNPPIEPLWFKPSNFTISAISLGLPTVVTTQSSASAPVSNNFVIGQLVRFHIPQSNGTIQLNKMTGYVVSLPSATQVGVSINSSGFNSFVASLSTSPYQPQITALGDINSGVTNATALSNNGTTVPGSFINTSPILQT